MLFTWSIWGGGGRHSRKTEYLCLAWFFIPSIYSAIEIVFNKKNFIPHWRYQLPEIKWKKIFYLRSYESGQFTGRRRTTSEKTQCSQSRLGSLSDGDCQGVSRPNNRVRVHQEGAQELVEAIIKKAIPTTKRKNPKPWCSDNCKLAKRYCNEAEKQAKKKRQPVV